MPNNLKKKRKEKHVRVQCMCALVNWWCLKLGLSWALLAGPARMAPPLGVTFDLLSRPSLGALQSCSVS